MPRFFIGAEHQLLPSAVLPSGGFAVTGEDAHHIAYSLRMRVGDRLTLCNGAGTEYLCEILSFDRTDQSGRSRDVTVTARILSEKQSETEPSFRATLFQAVPKAGKMDEIIQKAVETGVSDVVPFLNGRCISRPDAESAQKKRCRWQKIAAEAAMQCGRGIIPAVHDVISYDEAIRRASPYDLAFLCYEGEGTLPLGRIMDKRACPATVAFLVGAEGGFSAEEAQAATDAGLLLAGLGKRILRCETAPVFVLSCLSCRYDLR